MYNLMPALTPVCRMVLGVEPIPAGHCLVEYTRPVRPGQVVNLRRGRRGQVVEVYQRYEDNYYLDAAITGYRRWLGNTHALVQILPPSEDAPG